MNIKKSLTLASVSLAVAGGAIVAPIATAAPAQAINVCRTVVVAKQYNFAQALLYCQPFQQYNKPARCYGDVTKVVCSR